MSKYKLHLRLVLLGVALNILQSEAICSQSNCNCSCYNVTPINRTLQSASREQPLYATFIPRSPKNMELDNVCYTVCTTNDGIYAVSVGNVYKNGTKQAISYLTSQKSIGVYASASTSYTYTGIVFGRAGCSYLNYRCNLFGDCQDAGAGEDYIPILGISPVGRSIGSSTMQKALNIIRESGLPEQDYYVLPMKLPRNCIPNICANIYS